MILDKNHPEVFNYEVWDKNTNTRLSHIVCADDETGEYSVCEVLPKNSGNPATGLQPIGYRVDGHGDICILHKKGNIEFRKRVES